MNRSVCWALAALLPMAAMGCEGVTEVPGGILDPPPRLKPGTAEGAAAPVANDPPAHPPQTDAAVSPPAHSRPSLPEPWGQLVLKDPLRAGPVGEFTVITTLPHLTPPRAIVRAGNGKDYVVALGGRLGENGAIVTAVTPSAITVTELRLDAGTQAVGMVDVRLHAAVPAPGAAQDTPPAQHGDKAPSDDAPAPGGAL